MKGWAHAWANLGKVCLAGFAVTAPPLLWSLTLVKARRAA